MTLEEMTILADLMRGRDITQVALAERLVETYRDLTKVQAELGAARAAARRKPHKHYESKLNSLEQRLASKEKALGFAIQRNEVLRRQLTQALGGGPLASRPAHLLAKKEATT